MTFQPLKSVAFSKMQGLGNDFIVIELGSVPLGSWTSEKIRKICHRHLGIGADQLLLLGPPETPQQDVFMHVFNADGSRVEMCGNGIRAVGLYLQQKASKRSSQYQIGTLAGDKIVTLLADGVSVNMGIPQLKQALPLTQELLEWEGKVLPFYEVGMGNPHAVFFVGSLKEFPVSELGPFVEVHSRFPQRTNVEFVEMIASNEMEVRVWERGVGLTLACGTGACAAAVASIALSQAESAHPVLVHLPGGILKIRWGGTCEDVVWMEGPAETVFQGVYEFPVGNRASLAVSKGLQSNKRVKAKTVS